MKIIDYILIFLLIFILATCWWVYSLNVKGTKFIPETVQINSINPTPTPSPSPTLTPWTPTPSVEVQKPIPTPSPTPTPVPTPAPTECFKLNDGSCIN